MDTYYKNVRVTNLTSTPISFEHIAAAILKVILLTSTSVMFFSYNNFAIGSAFAISAYCYFFYGIFIKQPEEAQPSAYMSGSAWNTSKSARIKRDNQKSKTRNKHANYSSHKPVGSSPQIQNSVEDSLIYDENINAEIIKIKQINPATGLLLSGGFDAMGNPNGFNNSDVFTGNSFENNDFCGGNFASDDCMSSFTDEY
jgi:hypothetical protein